MLSEASECSIATSKMALLKSVLQVHSLCLNFMLNLVVPCCPQWSLLPRAHHHTGVAGTANNRREDSVGGFITSEASLAHSRVVINRMVYILSLTCTFIIACT